MWFFYLHRILESSLNHSLFYTYCIQYIRKSCWLYFKNTSHLPWLPQGPTTTTLVQNPDISAWASVTAPSLFGSQESLPGTSLVAQWLRIRLPMQGTWVRAVVQEDTTCHGVAKPVRVPQLLSLCSRARKPQLLKPAWLEPVLCNKRSHCNEKPVHRNKE